MKAKEAHELYLKSVKDSDQILSGKINDIVDAILKDVKEAASNGRHELHGVNPGAHFFNLIDQDLKISISLDQERALTTAVSSILKELGYSVSSLSKLELIGLGLYAHNAEQYLDTYISVSWQHA